MSFSLPSARPSIPDLPSLFDRRRLPSTADLPSAELDTDVEEQGQEEIKEDRVAHEVDEDDQAISPIAFPLVNSEYDKS